MTTAHENLLSHGLSNGVDLGVIHRCAMGQSAGAPLSNVHGTAFADDTAEMGDMDRKVTLRDYVLTHGLIDWVSLATLHTYIKDAKPGTALSDLQSHTVALVRSLMTDGLYEVGDLSGEGGRFVAWGIRIDESMRRIYDQYVTHFDDSEWAWDIWFDLTEKGELVARAIDESREDSP